jgi:hypothetical protein
MEKDLNYFKNNAQEDYNNTPISVLRYITELENTNDLFISSRIKEDKGVINELIDDEYYKAIVRKTEINKD